MFRFLFTIFTYSTINALSCIGDTGQTTDSWVAFKEPQGTKYLYYDGDALTPSKHSMNATTVGALANTVSQLWNPLTQYIIYNDEPPMSNKPYNYSVGHTKGIWAWTQEGEGFLLLHSIPLYPEGPSQVKKYSGLGGNAYMYGQNVACFTVSASTLNQIATSALLTVADIYDSRVDSTTPSNLLALANGAARTNPVCEHQTIETVGKTPLTYFAKSSQWNNELYSACIAPESGEPLYVESWIRGSAEGPSCAFPEVLDIKTLQFTSTIGFSEVNDHSKWAVSDGSFLCAADINRMTTQYVRGGSAVCWNDTTLATTLRNAITSSDNSC